MSQIRDITPIKYGMNPDEAKLAAKDLLCKTLNSSNRIKKEDVMSSDIKKCSSGPRKYNLVTLKDNSSWVEAASDSTQRIIGANYLEEKLPTLTLNLSWKVPRTKYLLINKDKKDFTFKIEKFDDLLVLKSSDIISFSEYVGDTKPNTNMLYAEDKDKIKKITGFNDWDLEANLREKDDTIFIIDTEYRSFAVPTTQETTSDNLIGLEFNFPINEILGQTAEAE